MRIKLLNAGGYGVFGHAEFPVVVEDEYDESTDTYDVNCHELRRVGFKNGLDTTLCFDPWSGECEVLVDA